MNDFTVRLRELSRLREAMREAKRAHERAKEAHDRYQADLYEAMREVGLTSVGTDEHTYVAKGTIYATMTDRAAFIEWARDHGLLEEFTMVKEVEARLNELVRQRLDDGEEPPPGVDWYRKTYISQTQK